jgi:hypothetical protein
MNSVVAFASIVTASTVALVGAFLLFRLIKTMMELRRVTTGLNTALGWALGHVSAEANTPQPARQTPQLLP